MTKAIVLACVLLLAGSASGQLAPYWIQDAGCVKTFGGSDWVEYTEEAQFASGAALPMSLYRIMGEGWDLAGYTFDADGDLCWGRTDSYRGATDPHEYAITYTPPLKILDYPLETGKTWHATATWRTTAGGFPRTSTVDGTVVGPRTIETAVGRLDVIEVTLVFHEYYPPTWTRSLLLHDQLGVVSDVNNPGSALLSAGTCGTVAGELNSWGGIKALYR